MEAWYEYDAPCNCDVSDVQNERSRPMPVTILHQQGVHPNPGPEDPDLVSIMDDECWMQWGMVQGYNADSQIDDNDKRAEWHPGSSVLPGALKVCDLTRMDDSDDSSHEERHHADGFSDWYGDRSSVDHLCRGRHEEVIGTEWIDEAAYFGTPLSLRSGPPCAAGPKGVRTIRAAGNTTGGSWSTK